MLGSYCPNSKENPDFYHFRRSFGFFPASLAASPAAPIEVREPPGSAGCAPVAQATRLGPQVLETPQRPPKLKRKKQSIMGNAVPPFKAPKPRQAHASLSLHSRVGGREAKGVGSPFPPPPRAPLPVIRPPPQVLQEPAGQQWRTGESFLRSCLAPLYCTLVLACSQVLRAPSPPTLVNCQGSQLRQRRSVSSQCIQSPARASTQGTCLWPAPGRWLARPSRCGPACQDLGAACIFRALLARDSQC